MRCRECQVACSRLVFLLLLLFSPLFRSVSALTASSTFSGESHSGVIDSLGDLYTSGKNNDGQLGLGHSTDQSDFQQVPGLSNIASGCAWDHTVVIDTSGNLWTWGKNAAGQLGTGNTDSQNSPQSISIDALVSVGCGDEHTIGLATDGKIWSWGEGGSGQLGHGNTNDELSPRKVGGAINSRNVIKASAGRHHTGAVTDGGELYLWGLGADGRLGTGNFDNQNRPEEVTVGGETFVNVALGEEFSLALSASGKVYSFGKNDQGQLGDGTTTSRNTPIEVIPSEATAIAAGRLHSVALISDGSVRVWGDNSSGQLGLGDTTDRLSPTTVGGVTDVSHISAGSSHTVFVFSYGSVSGVGANSFGQLGVGNTDNVTSLVQSLAFGNATDECTGGTHNCNANAACTDTAPSFTCACNNGYNGDGISCTDVDECGTGVHNCAGGNSTCSDTVGSFTCACNSGFTGDGVTSCTASAWGVTDECTEGSHNCNANAVCKDTAPSFTCACNDGYGGDGISCTGEIAVVEAAAPFEDSEAILERGRAEAETLEKAFDDAESEAGGQGTVVNPLTLRELATLSREVVELVATISLPEIPVALEDIGSKGVAEKTAAVNKQAETEEKVSKVVAGLTGRVRDAFRSSPTLLKDSPDLEAAADDLWYVTRRLSTSLGELTKLAGTGRQAAENGVATDSDSAVASREAGLQRISSNVLTAVDAFTEITESRLDADPELQKAGGAFLESREILIAVNRLQQQEEEASAGGQGEDLGIVFPQGVRIVFSHENGGGGSRGFLSALLEENGLNPSCSSGESAFPSLTMVAWSVGPWDFSVGSRGVKGGTSTVSLRVCGQTVQIPSGQKRRRRKLQFEEGEEREGKVERSLTSSDQGRFLVDLLLLENREADAGVGQPFDFGRGCHFWDESAGKWSSDGCYGLGSNGTHLHCRCSHLTDFVSLQSDSLAVVSSLNVGVFSDFEKAAENLHADNVAMWLVTGTLMFCFALLLRAALLDCCRPLPHQKAEGRVDALVGNDAILGRLLEGPPAWHYSRMSASCCKCKGLRKNLRKINQWRKRNWFRELVAKQHVKKLKDADAWGGEKSVEVSTLQTLQTAAENAIGAGMTHESQDLVLCPDGTFLVFSNTSGVVVRIRGEEGNVNMNHSETQIARSPTELSTVSVRMVSSLPVETTLRTSFEQWRTSGSLVSEFVPPERKFQKNVSLRERVMTCLGTSRVFPELLKLRERERLRKELRAAVVIRTWIRKRIKERRDEREKEGNQAQKTHSPPAMQLVGYPSSFPNSIRRRSSSLLGRSSVYQQNHSQAEEEMGGENGKKKESEESSECYVRAAAPLPLSPPPSQRKTDVSLPPGHPDDPIVRETGAQGGRRDETTGQKRDVKMDTLSVSSFVSHTVTARVCGFSLPSSDSVWSVAGWAPPSEQRKGAESEDGGTPERGVELSLSVSLVKESGIRMSVEAETQTKRAPPQAEAPHPIRALPPYVHPMVFEKDGAVSIPFTRILHVRRLSVLVCPDSEEAGADEEKGGERQESVVQIFCKFGKNKFLLQMRSGLSNNRGNSTDLETFAFELSERLTKMREAANLRKAPEWRRRELAAQETARGVRSSLWDVPRSLWKSFVRDHPFVYLVDCSEEGVSRVDKALVTCADIVFTLAVIAVFFGADGEQSEYNPGDAAVGEILSSLLGVFSSIVSWNYRVVFATFLSEVISVIPLTIIEGMIYRRPPFITPLAPLLDDLQTGRQLKMSKVELLIQQQEANRRRRMRQVTGRLSRFASQNLIRLKSSLSMRGGRSGASEDEVDTRTIRQNQLRHNMRRSTADQSEVALQSSAKKEGLANPDDREKKKMRVAPSSEALRPPTRDGSLRREKRKLWLLPAAQREKYLKRAFVLQWVGRVLALLVFLSSAYYLFMFSLVYASTPDDLKGFFTSSGFCFLIDSLVRPLAVSFVATALTRMLVRRNSRIAVRVLSGFPELSHFSSQKSSDTLDSSEGQEESLQSSIFLVDDSGDVNVNAEEDEERQEEASDEEEDEEEEEIPNEPETVLEMMPLSPSPASKRSIKVQDADYERPLAAVLPSSWRGLQTQQESRESSVVDLEGQRNPNRMASMQKSMLRVIEKLSPKSNGGT